MLPQEDVEEDSKRFIKKLPEGIGRAISFNIFNTTIADAEEMKGQAHGKCPGSHSLNIIHCCHYWNEQRKLDEPPRGHYKEYLKPLRSSKVLLSPHCGEKLLKVIQSKT